MVNFCLSLSIGKEFFESLQSLDKDIQHDYWRKSITIALKPEDIEFAERVVSELLAHERPIAAVNASSFYLTIFSGKKCLTSDLLAKTLEYSAIKPSDQQTLNNLTSYEMSRLLGE